MKDKQFLIFIHDRLEKVHGENRNIDYMHKLRAIIYNTDDTADSQLTAPKPNNPQSRNQKNNMPKNHYHKVR